MSDPALDLAAEAVLEQLACRPTQKNLATARRVAAAVLNTVAERGNWTPRARLTQTHTYAVLEVSPAVYREIRESLETAWYQHAFHQGDEGEVIDMHGIALSEGRACAASEGRP